MIKPEELGKLAAKKRPENKVFFSRLSRYDKRKLDELFHDLHAEVFEQTDCLACANCCKSLGPRITDADIRRVSKSLHIKPSQFTDDFLRIDEDGDYVFKSMPCPFLQSDNRCRIYDDRPAACREYPHTNRPRMYQVLDLTIRNIETCPAVFSIVEMMKQKLD